MSNRILSGQLAAHVGEEVLVKGWLHSIRSLGKINFVLLRDREGVMQIVVEDKEQYTQIKNLQPGSILYVTGEVKEASNLESGAEVINPRIEVERPVIDVPPVEYSKPEVKADMDTILDYRPLTLRNERISAVFKIQATIVAAYREFLTKQGFTEFFGPNVISASSEGGTELFTVNYFDQEVKLSQSAQLYKQMMVGVYERVFALMKCFRAEKSNTRRHLTEATQFEFEMGFIEDFSDVMDMLERVVKFIVAQVEEKNSKELKTLGVDLAKAPEEVSFPRVKFRDAVQLVYKLSNGEVDDRAENDLSPQAEKVLCEYARKEFGTDFIFVTHFLRTKTAFYAHPNQEDPTVSNYFDLLCREAEIVSGGQRVHDPELLVTMLEEKGLNPQDFEDYISIFRYGMPKHGGFGMGMERLTMLLLGLDNIREAVLFPSDPKRVAGVRLKPRVYQGKELIMAIEKSLNSRGYNYEKMSHRETKTSEESAHERGTKLGEGVKAIILRGKNSGKNVMVCLPSDQKVDTKRIKELEGENFEFEKPEVIASKYGLEVGGVPPFGNLLGMKVYFDPAIKAEARAAFNCGSTAESIIMQSSDLIALIEPEFL